MSVRSLIGSIAAAAVLAAVQPVRADVMCKGPSGSITIRLGDAAACNSNEVPIDPALTSLAVASLQTQATQQAAQLATQQQQIQTLQAQLGVPAPACFDNENRYVDCGNGTVTDTVTGLIWLKNADCFPTIVGYSAANQAATALADGQCGLTDGSSARDWRLPTRAEWEATIARAVALGCQSPSLTDDTGTTCLNAGPTSFTAVESSHYWSSSAKDDLPHYAWLANLLLGNATDTAFKDGNNFAVWPVRGGTR
jgi:hypothetical protein